MSTQQSPATQDPADRLPLRPLLRFASASFEQRFVEHYVSFYLRYAQASLVLGLVLVLGDFLVDFWAQPGLKANFLRIELSLPVLALGLAFSFMPAARKHWQPVMAAFIAATALCLFWILLRIDNEGGSGLKTWVGVLNFTFLEFYCFVILGVQFRYALASGTVILCAFESAMWSHAGLTGSEVAYWSYHVLTLFTLPAGIGWWREFLLRKEFAARTSLNDARESAEQLARVKGDFLATMSHEIRTPLNGVLGMNELLIGSGLQPQQRAWAEGVQSSGRHLLGVINDILDFSKVDSGRMELEAVDFDLVDAVEEAVLMFAQPAESKGLELAVHCEPPAEQLLVRGDPFRLRQVIANLVSNAIKFTSQGEVIARVSASDFPGGDVAIGICVQDTGVGIAPQAQGRIFEHFSQADGSTTRHHGGTGLGLAICKRLLELMGGHIRVESMPGRGSKFHVDLRLPRGVDTRQPAPASAALEGVRVLVVDDNNSARDILQQQLRGWAMAVSNAADGASALRLIEQAALDGQPFALAVLDLHMPRMDGLQLAHAIQDMRSQPPTRLVMLGSIGACADARTRQQLSQLACVNKPVRRAELLRALTGALAATSTGWPAAPLAAVGHSARLRGHILLVEDNAINQQLATAMVEGIGPTVSLANDGAEAVEMVRRQAFDLVLMDCQMPVMDGLEATRQIRALETARGPGRPALPIIALTANVMVGDRKACIAAGMSDFLTKPITGAGLEDVLARYLGRIEPASRAVEIPPVQPVALPGLLQPAFDPTVLAELPMVANGTAPGFARSILDQFVVASGKAIDNCRDAETASDDDTMRRGMHTLKSISAQVGAMALAATAGELEHRLRAGRPLDAGAWAQLQAEHRRALRAIATHLGPARQQAPGPLSDVCPT